MTRKGVQKIVYSVLWWVKGRDEKVKEDVVGPEGCREKVGKEGLSVRLVQHNRKAVLGPDSKQMFNCFRAVLTLLDCVPPLKGGGGAENSENPAADERERERDVGG